MIKVSAAALCGILAYLLLKSSKPELAPLCEICTAAVIFLFIADELIEIKSVFSSMSAYAGITREHLVILLKALGAALVSQFAADTARDAGESALASKIEFAGRVVIIYCSLPLLRSVAQLITSLAENM